jgi:3-oxoacyl-[acyl-carrier-protein] synthase II
MELKRVVITGLGAITPIGNNLEEYWDGLIKRC